jgi:Carbohydrate-binding module 48 (Isoamylase N-terminal domain)
MRDDAHDMNDQELSPPLSDALPLLRELPNVRAEWRAGVLRDVARSEQSARRVSLSLPWAIAAGLFCALAGGGAVIVATRARPSTPPPAVLAASPTPTMLPVRFTVVAPRAARVAIVGDFNHWNPATLPMRRSPDGQTWEIEVKLPVGHYSYAFLIDGTLAPDPAAPRGGGDDFGRPNSVLMVRGS